MLDYFTRLAAVLFILTLLGLSTLLAYARFLEPVQKDLDELSGDDVGKLVLVSGRAASVSVKNAAFIKLCKHSCVDVFIPQKIVEEMQESILDVRALGNKWVGVEGVVRENARGIEIDVIEASAVDVLG